MMDGTGSDSPSAGSPRIGGYFLAALAARDFAALASCFADEARFRALLPSGLREATGSAEPARYFKQWFGSADRIQLLDSQFEPIADRHHLSWRFRVHRDAQPHVIEQQAFATIRSGRFVQFDLVCSGFRPEEPRNGRRPRCGQERRLRLRGGTGGGRRQLRHPHPTDQGEARRVCRAGKSWRSSPASRRPNETLPPGAA